ncbi:hypothetical protein M885DRAFT_257468 [Pelagophyceae sp. CCMP2097]|nr:hypothetical protein M885DRAFT_257468 [Pelagophyceae sp. CCMP2097]
MEGLISVGSRAASEPDALDPAIIARTRAVTQRASSHRPRHGDPVTGLLPPCQGDVARATLPGRRCHRVLSGTSSDTGTGFESRGHRGHSSRGFRPRERGFDGERICPDRGALVKWDKRDVVIPRHRHLAKTAPFAHAPIHLCVEPLSKCGRQRGSRDVFTRRIQKWPVSGHVPPLSQGPRQRTLPRGPCHGACVDLVAEMLSRRPRRVVKGNSSFCLNELVTLSNGPFMGTFRRVLVDVSKGPCDGLAKIRGSFQSP